jgi:hypothetical protein
VVFFGIVGEIIVIVSEDGENKYDWARGIVLPPDRAPRWRFWFDIIATIIVLLGVLGEAWGSSQLASINSQLRSKTSELRADSDQLLALVTQEAGDAVISAKTVRKEAGDIQQRLDRASSQLSEIEEAVHAQGPRAVLITAASPKLIKELAPFAGQKVDLFVCGVPKAPRSLQNEETMNTWGSIARILEGSGPKDKGANWSVLHGGLTFLLPTLGCAGIEVFVSSEAPKKTTEAAKALGIGLEKVLPPSPNKMPNIINAGFSRMKVKRGLEFENEPWNLVAAHPDEITVFVGPHP